MLATFYYPFLTASADGVDVPIACDPATGLMAASIAPGSMVTIVKKPPPVERLGYAITLASLVLFAMGELLMARRRGRIDPANVGPSL